MSLYTSTQQSWGETLCDAHFVNRKSFHSLSVMSVMHQREARTLWLYDRVMMELFTYVFTQYSPIFLQRLCLALAASTVSAATAVLCSAAHVCSVIVVFRGVVSFFIPMHLNYIMSPQTHHSSITMLVDWLCSSIFHTVSLQFTLQCNDLVLQIYQYSPMSSRLGFCTSVQVSFDWLFIAPISV